MFLSELQGIQMGIVGANQWKGGFTKYTLADRMLSSYEPEFMEQDSYLGKNIKVITN